MISKLKVSIQSPDSNNEEYHKIFLQQKDEVIQALLKSNEENIKYKEENIQTHLKSKDETIQILLKSKDEVITIMKISSEQSISELKTKNLDLNGRLSMRWVMEDFEEMAPKEGLSAKQWLGVKQSPRDSAWNLIFERNIRQINDHLQLESSPSEEEKAHWIEIGKSLHKKLCKRVFKHGIKVAILTLDLSDEEATLVVAICKATPVIFEVG